MTQPREYDLSKPEEISRLLMEVHGYMKVSLKDGTDHKAASTLTTQSASCEKKCRNENLNERGN